MVTLFSNGRLMTGGGRSRFSCTIALRKVARMLRALPEYKDQIEDGKKHGHYRLEVTGRVIGWKEARSTRRKSGA